MAADLNELTAACMLSSIWLCYDSIDDTIAEDSY